MADASVISDHIDYVFLLFLRVSGLLIGSPIFGRNNVPSIFKIGLCIMLSSVFVMSIPAPDVYPTYENLFMYFLVCIREILFGVAMGYVLTTMFSLALTSGSIIDYQIGFSMVSVYDPQFNTQTPITGSLLNIILLLVFFSYDGHLKLIEIVYKTFETVPVGAATAPKEILLCAAETMSSSFVLAVMVAMPIIAAGMIVEVAMGIIIRTVPQMNVFVVGIPMKLLIGILMLMLSIAGFVGFTKTIYSKAFDYVGEMFDYLAGTK